MLRVWVGKGGTEMEHRWEGLEEVKQGISFTLCECIKRKIEVEYRGGGIMFKGLYIEILCSR